MATTPPNSGRSGVPGRAISAKNLFADVAIKRGEYESELDKLQPGERQAKIEADNRRLVQTAAALRGTGILVVVKD